MVSEEAFRVACKTAGATQVSEAAAKAAIEVLINKQVALAQAAVAAMQAAGRTRVEPEDVPTA